MRRLLGVLGLTVGLILSIAAPASASTHTPTGREFYFIVAHETGHCLGWWLHKTGYTVMRASYNRDALNAGTQPYKPTATDRAIMDDSRDNYWWGEKPNSYVTAPYFADSVPVLNKTGRSAAFPAANEWDYGTRFAIWQTYSEPAHGITIRWDWSLAGTKTAGLAVAGVQDTGKFNENVDCEIRINPRIGT